MLATEKKSHGKRLCCAHRGPPLLTPPCLLSNKAIAKTITSLKGILRRVFFFLNALILVVHAEHCIFIVYLKLQLHHDSY